MAIKNVKKTVTAAKKTVAKKVQKTNLDKVQATAKKVNAEIQKTATFVAKDIQKVAKNMDLSASTDKIQATAKKVNTQITSTTTSVTDALVKEGKKMGEEAIQKAKKAMKSIDVAQGVEKATFAAKEVNAYSLKTADEIIDVTKKNSLKWQKVAHKAVEGGFKIADKQQDLVFDTLETVKKQLVKNTSRLVKIFTK